MKLIFPRALVVAGLLVGPALAVADQPEILLEQNFTTTAKRSTQDLPSSAAWFVSEADGVLQNKRGLSSAPNRHLVAYFAETVRPVTLAVGESLSLQLSFSVREPLAKPAVFRIGFFNSGGKHLAVDGAGPSNEAFTGYQGYSAHLDFNTAKAISFYRRTEGLSDKLIAGNEAYGDALLRGAGAGAQFQSDMVYTLNFKLTRTAGGMTLSCDIPELNGYEATVDDTQKPFVAFDTVVIYGARSGMSRFTLDRIKIEK